MMEINALQVINALMEEFVKDPIPVPVYLATTMISVPLVTTATEMGFALEEEQTLAMIIRNALLTLALDPNVSM